ncbi:MULTISPECIES: EAL domain-containing protein [unclassified Legionella]|uniref:EAL domain-containing protein n=1 Tax=unclassified Legionella TaxID=2622702 RepID=UPI001E441598|nr:EAL domain-containing protein [Legionella sp. 31fI33]MCC5015084.1 EAL domain-containing protein [Legionella sp. 31fI33]
MKKRTLKDQLNPACGLCETNLKFDFTFAFQPIVDVNKEEIFAYEALVRGLKGEGAEEILSKVNDTNRYRFDQECRIRSIFLAQKLGMKECISINFLPNAIYSPELCIRTTIAAAEKANFPLGKIIFEVTESEQIHDPKKLLTIFQYYQNRGFATAIDDFGAGYAGLGLLSDFQPNFIKIDIKLVRNINSNPVKQAMVKGIILTVKLLNIKIIAEGIETAAEARWFKENGISLMQGYYFASPGFECLPKVTNWSLTD